MAYKTAKLLKQALEAIEKNKLIFVDDVIAFLPCSKETFYVHFPSKSDLHKTIVQALERNRVEIKVSMRSKWYKSDAPALQIGLYKLLSTEEELRRLTQTHSKNENKEEVDLRIEGFSWEDIPKDDKPELASPDE